MIDDAIETRPPGPVEIVAEVEYPVPANRRLVFRSDGVSVRLDTLYDEGHGELPDFYGQNSTPFTPDLVLALGNAAIKTYMHVSRHRERARVELAGG